jgi:hypothetical protein|tara:strand:+ start:1607 stop:1813 length:207 start_codon:yes stop_codon:yes gene_type:complete
MGHIIKYIVGDINDHPKYGDWCIEHNANNYIHIHLKNLRIDMSKKAYNQFFDMIKEAREKIWHDKEKP